MDSSAPPPLVVILGPTGVGKTALALRLAGRWGGEIVGADSLQVYRGMDIGTAKPTPAEQRLVPHHLIDVVDPDEPFDASRYCEMAHRTIARLTAEGKPVFVVGGSGLYIRALLGGLIDGPGADESLRLALKEEQRRLGGDALYERLRLRDPQAAGRIDRRDAVRIIRALEVLELTGRSIVDHQRDHRFQQRPYRALKIGLTIERAELLARIDARAERMIADGFVEEVRRLLERGYHRDLKPMQSLGYRHLAAHLAGEGDLAAAIRLLKRDTRRYAKRQLTWFSRDTEIRWLAPSDEDRAAGLVARFFGAQ
ncbi:MAG: tRNA (adenosine(37)-N6)-dimethylallyltransferase MiaA [Syntrophales bacterium]